MPPDFKSFLNSGRPAADYFGNSAPDPYIDFLNGGKPAAEFYAPEPEPEPEPVPEPIPEPVAAPVEGPAPLTQADMPSPFSPFGQAQVQDTAPTLSAESKDQINLDAASIDANLEGDDRTRFKRNVTDPLTKSGYGLGTVAAATRASHAAQNLVKIQAYQDARASGDEAATARALARLNENPVKAQDPEFIKERREFWLERLAEESASSAQRRDKQEGIKSHPAVEHAMAGSSGSFFRTLGSKHFMSLIWGLAAESAAYMAPSLALGGAAGLGLKAAGTTAQMLGFAGGTGTGSFWVDSNFTMLEAMADAGVDITDSQSLIKAFQDESIMADAREKGLKKGLAVGIFDAISGGIATKLMVPKSMLLSGPFRRQAVNVPAQLGAQAVLGGTGEALGQKVAYGEVQNWVEVYAEAIAELGTAPLEVATAAYSAGSGAEAIARAKLKKAGIDVASIDIEDPEYMENVRFGLWLEVEADLAQTKKGQSITVEERELKSAYIVEDMLRAVLPQYADHVDSMEAAAGEIVAAAKERKALTGGPQKQAPITAEDEASPIDSELIAEGTAIQNDVAAGTPDIAPADPSPLIDDAPLVTPDPTISLKNDGSPFPTKPAAWVAAKSRKDLRGRTLEVVEVEGGFGLREPVVSQTEAEADPPLAPAQQDLSGTPPTVQTAPAAQPSSGGEAVVAGEPTDYAAMGKKAFEDGLPAEPPADVIAGGVPAITAWGDAWMKANVAAPVPGVTDPATLAQDKIDQEARTKEILGDNYRAPELKHGENSWVVVERGTLNSVLETTERATADNINQEKYEVLTAGDYLGRKNAETKKDNTQKGPVMGEPAAETIDLTETPEQVVERRVDEIYNEPDNAKSKEQIRGELQNSPAESADNPTEKPETKKPQEPAKADNPPEKLKTPKPELPAKESTTKPVESNETPPVKDKADYGADNKLVTAERAEELRKKLSAKFKSQLGSGIDPEMLAMGTELAVFHIESGTRKFVSLAQKMAESMGITLEQLRPYLRSWYNGARDMIEDSGGNVDNMDTADEVRAALKTLGQESPEDTADKAPPAVEKTKPKKANRVRGKKIDREPQTILQAIASYGGMNDKDGWIEEAGHLNNFQPAFGKPFKKTGGMQIDYIIEQLIADRFLPEGSESPALYEAINLAARKLVEGRRPEDVAEVEEDPDQKRAEMEALAEDYGLNSKDLTDEKLEQLIDNYLESIEADGDYMEHEGDIGYDPHPQEQDDEIPFESDTDGNNAPEGENGDARGEQAGIVPGTESGGAQNGTHKQETEAGDKPATAETETVDTVDGPRPQGIIPGAKGSNQQLVDSKGDKLKTKKEQDEPGGMFGETTKEKVAKRDKENEAGQGNLLTPGDQNAPSSNADLERDSEVSSSDGVRQEDVSAPGSADGRGVDFTTAETNHAKKNIPLFVASLNSRVEREEYTRLNQIAKQNNGYYSKFSRNGAIPGFQFETEADREAFLAVASKGGDEATPQFSRRHSDPSDNVGKGGVTVTGEFSDAATTDLLNDLVAALKKIDPRGHIALRLKKTISAVIDGEVEFMDGQYLRGLIEVALDAKKDKGWVLNHEVIHALRKLGVIRESEWTALSKAVLRNKARMDDVRERSTGQNLSEEKLIEEAIADLFADFQAGNVDKKGFERTAWDRVVEFFNALGDLLIGKGFNTIDSIFNRIASGEVGMRNTDAELAADAAMDGDSFMRRGTPTQNRAINKITDVTDHRPLMERIMDTGANLWEDAKNEWVWATADNALGQRQMGLALNPEAADRELASYVAASLASHNAGQMEAMIRWGAPYWDSEYGVMRQDDTGGLYTILEPIFSGNLEGLFNGYAYARRVRAQKLIREGREHNLTEEDVTDLLALGDEHPELVEVFDKLQVYMKKVLDMAEDMGLINDEQRNGDQEKGTVGWENMDYVPFYRHIEEGSGVTGPRRTRGLTGQSAGIKRLTGGKKLWGVIEDSTGSVMGRFEKKSEANALRKKLGKTTHEVEAMGQPIPSIVENIAKNITHLVDASMTNVAAVLAIDEGLELGIIEKVSMARIRALVSTSAAVSTLKKQGLVIDGDLEKVSLITAMAAIADPVKLGNNIVSIRRDGKVEYYEVHNRIVYKSIGQLYRQEMSGYILTPLIYTKTFFTRSITAFPAFMARNFGRDSGSSWLISEERSNNFYKEMWASMKALTISMDDPQVRELMAAGGDVGFYQNAPKDILKQLRQMEKDNKLVHLLNPLELFMRTFRAWEHHVGRRGELANRNVTFKRIKDATKGDIRQGAFAAGDLMDFYKRGGSDLAVLLTSISPFLNARIQGLYKLARVGGRAAVKEGLMKKLMIKGGMMVGFTVAMALINMGDEGWDEDEELPAASGYNDLPEYVKDASWVINYWRILGRRNAMKVGLPQFGYIPKPFEIGAIFGTIPERMLQSIVGNDRSSASKQAMINLIMNTFAINPASNPWLLTPIELFANKDSFRDTPIESMSMENLPPEMRYNDRTSYLAKEAGKATGLSPAKIEHVVKGFTATLGDYILAASDAISDTIIGGAPPKASKRLDERNIIKSFVGQAPMRSTKWTDRFFELKKEISQQYSGLQKIKDDEGAVEYRRQSLLPENKGVGADMRKMNRVSNKLKKNRDKQTKIRRSMTMTPDEKRSGLDVLLSERNLLVKQETQRMEAKADKRDSLR